MANRLLDATTTLLGWINYTATDQEERVIAAGTTVKLSTPLDAADVFTFTASHPGHSAAVTFTLEVAPELKDGTMGTWVPAAEVAIPAAGGHVEAPISGSLLQVAAPDALNVNPHCMVYARVLVPEVPGAPAGAYVGLTY
ncbi:hypothetical protein KBY96_07715 [Cyanobium sp. ATX 6A2]|uniref:hypothetical protein n=1 Tax=Cyanobium sp. ATX 6A2 TaxID=2823700 RepID=UPI0020CC73F5|nr:hypothetical protein [Cyanobium sp. ATX 6A2]MCP9887817.1 hypothetical protein [Cyanobium sp. ATX 6A2]